MKWYGISGSWRRSNNELRENVEEVVTGILQSGGGIITGGALGVDYIATQTVLNNSENPGGCLKIYLPVQFERYLIHIYQRTLEKVVKPDQADNLVSQLILVRRSYPKCIFDNWNFKEVNPESYYARNSQIIKDCDELYAFHINKTKGVQDAINKAKKLNKPVHIREYSLK